MIKKSFVCLLVICCLISILAECGGQTSPVTDPPDTTAKVSVPDTTVTTEAMELEMPARWQSRDHEVTTIMSFNILTTEKTPIDTAQRNGMTRSETLKLLMEDCIPDSIGMCEVTSTWLSYLQEDLVTSLPYAIAGLTSSSGLALAASTGELNPILYRSDKYILAEDGGCWFSETPDEPSKYGDMTSKDGAGEYAGMDHCRIYSYAVLQNISTGEIAYVHINTHLDHKSDSCIDLICAQQIKAEADRLSKKYDCPVVITGDFNETEQDLAYLYLADASNGYANAKYQTKDFSPLTSQGGYGRGYKRGTYYVIDHIFVSAGDFTVVKHDVIEEPYISDHSPVYVELIIP